MKHGAGVLLLLSAWSFALAAPGAAADGGGRGELELLGRRSKVAYPPTPRKVFAFYYPWYGNPNVAGGSGRWAHWEGVQEDQGRIASSTHYPQLGPYDSHDPKLIAQHAAWSRQAGLDGWIASWWGHGSFSDRALPRILDGARAAGLDVTVYYERVPGDPTPESAAADILRLLRRYADHPAWLRVEGKPVVFVYGRAVGQLGVMGWLRVASQLNQQWPGGVALVGDQFSRAAAVVFDGVHTYNTAGRLRDKSLDEVRRWAGEQYPKWVQLAEERKRISTITVIPGYDDTKIRKPGLAVPRYEGASYRAQWEAAIAAGPDWILITSWNEWHEGSEIEPSRENGDRYLKLTAEMAERFKSSPRSVAADVGSPSRTDWPVELARLPIGLLPDADADLLLELAGLPRTPVVLSWEDVAELTAESVKRLPLLVYSGGEHYRSTAREPNDVDRGLLRYLRGGGLLLAIPNKPMPFHYDERGDAVGRARQFGLPLSVGRPTGGWETPPEGVALQFVQPERRLPRVPAEFPFPREGDLRWRPAVRSLLDPGDVYVPLLALRDGSGRRYGDAAALVVHRASPPQGARALYAWFGLRNTPHWNALLADLFQLAAREVLKPASDSR